MVEDDWDRGMDADLLHVTFDSNRITIDGLIAIVKTKGFEAKVDASE
jgi:hypothetical protein